MVRTGVESRGGHNGWSGGGGGVGLIYPLPTLALSRIFEIAD